MITNYDLRLRMRKVIRPNLQVLMVIALITVLPGLLVSVLTALTGTDVLNWLYTYGIAATPNEQMLEELSAFLLERGWIYAALNLAQMLITPVLLLGLINAVLTLLRGGTAVFSMAFSRLNAFVRSVGVSFWVAIKIILWELPPMLLVVAASFVAVQAQDISILLLAASIASIAATVLALMATYRYAMSFLFLADDPETGVFECVRRSKAVMKNRKMQLFSLEIPYLLGSSLLASLISTLLGGAVGTALSMMVQLIFTVYLYGARCAFYEAYARPEGGRTHAFQSDPYHDEMKE